MSSKLPIVALMAWLLVAIYHFYQYALRSAPSVMMPQLAKAFGINALGLLCFISDRFGRRKPVILGGRLVSLGISDVKELQQYFYEY